MRFGVGSSAINARHNPPFFAQQERFGDRSYEAQLNRASALSLVINAIIVWDTEYLAAAAAWSHITPLH